MAEHKNHLVDEQLGGKRPATPATAGHGADEQMGSEAVSQDTSADAGSGVADQDPLSAHPS